MLINNEKKSFRIKQWQILNVLIISTLAIILVLTDLIPENPMGITKIHCIILLVLIYFMKLFYDYKMEYNHFYYIDDDEKIIIRYYSLGFNSKLKHVIEIPKNAFYKWEIIKSFGKRKEMLVVYQKINGKIAKYPAISITALLEKDKEKLKFQLSKYQNQ